MKRSTGLALRLALCVSIALTGIAATPAPTGETAIAISGTERARTIEDFAQKLESTYLSPEIGAQYGAMLRRNLADGRYDALGDASRFAEAVTADIQALHADGHLRLLVLPPNQDGKREMRQPTTRSGIVRSGWIADDTAYIAFAGFPGNEATLAELDRFIAAHAGAANLVIDVRDHRGGGMDEINRLFPQLYTAETVLLDMDARESVASQWPAPDPTDYVRTLPGSPGIVRREHFAHPAGEPLFKDTKVYLLVGHDTVSAAEHLAMALKRTHRATLIGEATRGAGNFGMFREVAGGFQAFIPFGRTYDPVTGEGWEGVGVTPDVTVASAQALDKALDLIGIQKTGEAAIAELR